MDPKARQDKYRGLLRTEDGTDTLELSGPDAWELDLEDFRGVPELRLVVRQGSPQPTIELRDAPFGTTIVVTDPMRIKATGELNSTLVMDLRPATQGSSRHQKVALLEGAFDDVVLLNGVLSVQRNKARIRRLAVRTGTRIDFTVDQLELLRSGLTITLADSASIVTVIDGRDRPVDPVQVTFSADDRRSSATLYQLGGEFHIRLKRLALTVYQNNKPATITGSSDATACTLHVPPGQTLTGITVPNGEDVDLWLDEDATLRNFSGQCRIDKAVGATIEAAQGESFRYIGLAPAQSEPGDPVRGLTLRRVHIAPGHQGRSRLAELTEVRVLEPAISSKTYPPGWRRPFRSIDSLRKRAENDPGKAKAVDDLLDCTYFYQELDTLVADKCGSGAIRSRTAWNRARAQHLRSSRTERWMYGLFRLVGYGQRPIPPLLAWISMALVTTLAAIGLGADVSPSTSEFATLWLYLLFSPFVLFRFAAETQTSTTDLLSGLDPLDRQLILPLQVLVLAAFVFLLAAIRNYMRSTLPR